MALLVGKSSDLSAGGMMPAKLGPIPIVVVRDSGGQLYAMVRTCLHQGGPLDRGELTWSSRRSKQVGEYHVENDGHVLSCPWHHYEYNVATGEMIIDPTRRLRTFAVWEQGDEIFVDFKAPDQV